MTTSDRYERQRKLTKIGELGQHKLAKAQVLIMGLGGLGSAAAMQLASAGVGRLILNDFDIVETHNLPRQLIHRPATVGELKTDSARQTLKALNPDCEIRLLSHQLDEQELATEVEQANIVLDCSDNYESRFLINKICHRYKTALVYGAAIRLEGQTSIFLQQEDAPCYACIYNDSEQADEDCAGEGVLASLPAIIGEMQALQAILYLTDNLEKHEPALLLFDASRLNWQEIRLQRNPACTVCSEA